MHILMVGLNYRSAPIDIREPFSLAEDQLEPAVKAFCRCPAIDEAVILSTCNRTEVYFVTDESDLGMESVKAIFTDWFGLPRDLFLPYLTIEQDESAIRHLFRVACGLDSMILGETQILGQVRRSFVLASEAGTTGPVFHQLFKQALTLAKKAHTKTNISENAVSVSYAAVELAKQTFGNLSGKNILMIGAGKMSELAVKHLRTSGVTQVTVANRSRERAQALASRMNGQTIAIHQLESSLLYADILMSSTGSKDTILTKDTVQSVMEKRKGRPLFIVDMALPRDIDPGIHSMDGVFLYDIDDLNGVIQENLSERQKAAKKIEKMIEKERDAFRTWQGTQDVVQVISALRQKALAIQEDTMKSIEQKLPNLTEHEKKVLVKHTESIVNQILRDPIQNVKKWTDKENKEEMLAWLMQIFSIKDQVDEAAPRQTIKKRNKKNEYHPPCMATGTNDS